MNIGVLEYSPNVHRLVMNLDDARVEFDGEPRDAAEKGKWLIEFFCDLNDPIGSEHMDIEFEDVNTETVHRVTVSVDVLAEFCSMALALRRRVQERIDGP